VIRYLGRKSEDGEDYLWGENPVIAGEEVVSFVVIVGKRVRASSAVQRALDLA